MGTLTPHGFYEYEEADIEATGSDLLNLPSVQLEAVLGPVIDQSEYQAPSGWTDGLTPGSGITEVAGHEGQLYATGDVIAIRGRYSRAGSATGTVTWAVIDDDRYWPARVWELGNIGLQGTLTTLTRCFVDIDGGIKSFNTPSGSTGIFLSALLMVVP